VPTLRFFDGQAEVIQNAVNDGINQRFQRFRARIKSGARGNDVRAGFHHGDDVAGMDDIPRRLARHKDQLTFFFQKNIRRTKDHRLARARGDAPHRAHRTGDHHHGVKKRGAAHKGDIHRFVAMLMHAFRHPQFTKFLLYHLARVVAEKQMHLVLRRIDLVEKTLEIQCAARSRGCKD